MSRKILCILSLTLLLVYCNGQKRGDCPPPVEYNVCYNTCYDDLQCKGTLKCCPTSCGGTVCLRAVTMRAQEVSRGKFYLISYFILSFFLCNLLLDKPGNCPESPSGPWVCTSRCAFDSDCRGRLKCCENRCGAMACTKPES